MNVRLGVAIVLVLVAISAMVRESMASGALRDSQLTGVWTGEAGFLKESGLGQMYMYISPLEPDAESKKWKRLGYLYMVDQDGQTVSEQALEFIYPGVFKRFMGSAMNAGPASGAYLMSPESIVHEKSAIFPERPHLALNPAKGTLAIWDEETVFAYLVRDNEASLAAEESWETPADA